MAEYLRSALSYLSSSSVTKNENEFIGSNIAVGTLSLRVKRVIAEGGYGVVYEAQDASKGAYALKRLIASTNEAVDSIMQEIKLMKQLSGHPNIVKFYQAASSSSDKTKPTRTDFLIVTELCRGGQLSQFLPVPRQERPFSVNVVLQIIHQTCRAVQHMHNQIPPVIHRDLKIENLLLSEDFIVKLCDFGSASTVSYSPDPSWNALKRLSTKEELERFTTPMYRAPEMLDLYLNLPIGTSSDIWALGCILFYLCCTYHPFEDSSKLAILNASYTLPITSSEHTIFHSAIRQMLLLDPKQRPSITDVLGELSQLALARKVQVNGSISILDEVKKRRGGGGSDVSNPMAPHSQSNQHATVTNERESMNNRPAPNCTTESPGTHRIAHAVPPRPSAPPGCTSSTSVGSPTKPDVQHIPPLSSPKSLSQTSPEPASGVSATVNMFGMIKGGAGNWLRSLREASTKVLESVSATLSGDVDFQLITSRIAVMSYPSESSLESMASSNAIEEVQNLLNTRYPNSYAVYNLSSRAYRSDCWFDGRVSHRVFEPHRSPSFRSIIELCLNARLWLQQKPANVCVVHCTDGRTSSAMFVCSLLCFCQLFDNASPALQLFSSRRGNPRLNASQVRYIDYVAHLVHNRIPMPHHRPLNLISLTVAPIPTFNKTKNGCRPYVEIYEGKTRVLSTFTGYDSLRSYVLEDGKIDFVLNGVSVMGDLTVIVYHCRSSFTGRGKVASVKIAQFQLYTGFVEPNQTELIYFKSDLDHLDSSTGFSNLTSRYAESFCLTLEFMVSPNERPRHGKDLVYPWETLPPLECLRPDLVVSDLAELKSLLADFGRFNQTPLVTADSQCASRPSSGVFVTGSAVPDPLFDDSASSVDTRADDLRTTPMQNASVSAGTDMNETTHLHPEPDRSMDTTPFADLLGFTDSSPTSPSQPQHTDHLPTQSSNLNDLEHPGPSDSACLIDDLFNMNAQHSNSSDWATAFDRSSDHSHRPHSASNNNPFDPFGTPTNERFGSHDVPPPFVKKPTVNFDSLFSHTHLSTSASTSDLNNVKLSTGLNYAVYQSASFASLASNGTQTATRPVDPFADLTDLFSRTKRASGSASNISKPTPSASNSTTTSRVASPSTPYTSSSRSTTVNASSTTPTANRTTAPSSTPSRTGARPHVSKDAFSDLLGDFASSSSASYSNPNQSKTMNQMRRENLAKTTDPDQLKVRDWANGKERNVRALLCSLHTILWEGVRWTPVSILDLINPDQVKRQYRKAARAVHPDKWMNTENEQFARMVFVELNDAMTEFEKDPASSLFL